MGQLNAPLIAPRVRFAPSPTGSLHLGNARTALFNWLIARASQGTFVLRVENTDVDREVAGADAAILADLRWLGLVWDEGPYHQSERGEHYVRAVDKLLAVGAAFRCFCEAGADEPVRAAAAASSGHRDPCRGLSEAESARRAGGGEPFAVRFRVPLVGPDGAASVEFVDRLRGHVAVPLPQIGDAVLVRRGGRPTYNFAVVVDDAAMRIDLVLRGDDHLSNTPIQVLLYRALEAPLPAFAHVPMVLGPDGERLSKRHGATSVGSWRERGVPAEALVNGLALLGWAPSGDRTIVSLDEMVADFDLDRVGRSAAIFDPVKLDWISSQYIHAMPRPRLADEVGRALATAGPLEAADVARQPEWVAEVAEFLRPALSRFDQVGEMTRPLFHAGGAVGAADREVLSQAESARVLRALAEQLDAAGPGATTDWGALRRNVTDATGAKGKALFQPIRAALTGHAEGRELDRLWPLIEDGSRRLPGLVPSASARIASALEQIG